MHKARGKSHTEIPDHSSELMAHSKRGNPEMMNGITPMTKDMYFTIDYKPLTGRNLI
jgi:hypothetical protein